jgi:hypothetical protein
MRPRTIYLALVAAVLAVAVFPFKSVSCPSWHVTVIDESQKPVAGVTVRLSYQNYSAEGQSHDVDVISDENGEARFPAETLRASLVRRCLFTLLSARAGVHSSFGPHASVIAFGQRLEGFAVDSQRNVVVDWTGKPRHMESVITVRPSKL